MQGIKIFTVVYIWQKSNETQCYCKCDGLRTFVDQQHQELISLMDREKSLVWVGIKPWGRGYDSHFLRLLISESSSSITFTELLGLVWFSSYTDIERKIHECEEINWNFPAVFNSFALTSESERVRYRVQHSNRNSISTNSHTLFVYYTLKIIVIFHMWWYAFSQLWESL